MLPSNDQLFSTLSKAVARLEGVLPGSGPDNEALIRSEASYVCLAARTLYTVFAEVRIDDGAVEKDFADRCVQELENALEVMTHAAHTVNYVERYQKSIEDKLIQVQRWMRADMLSAVALAHVAG